MNRRNALTLLASFGALGCTTPAKSKGENMTTTKQSASVLFLAHGAPILLDDETWTRELATWGQSLTRPGAIVVISAHWQTALPTIGADHRVPLIYDFGGFPDKFYQLQYAYGDATDTRIAVEGALRSAGISFDNRGDRGLDHGVYVPLIAMFGDAHLPVLQVSLPRVSTRDLYRFGQALSPLSDQNILVVGSGFITHNLATFGMRSTPAWAREFDDWIADALARRDVDALLDYRAKAPSVDQCLPTHEHFLPLLVTLGAAQSKAHCSTKIAGFWGAMGGGSFSRRSIEFA
jgi:4,5-DOPA dioxygenase extradiol